MHTSSAAGARAIGSHARRWTTKVALVHHWLTGMRGGEKVLEALCDLFPSADIFTLVCDPARISEKLRRHRIITSVIQRLPFAPIHFRAYLPLFPLAAQQLDLSGYDLVITSDASLIKAVHAPNEATHICYCHSPPRYLWDLYDLYRNEEAGLIQRILMPPVAHFLRRADFRAVQSVDHFIANSRAVAARIDRHYHKPATVIYPPVDIDFFSDAKRHAADFYLFVGQLVAYKKADLAIRAMNELGRKLIIVGDGPQRKKLESIAGPKTRFVGPVSDEELRDYYSHCRALIFPNEEDFGIVPVEAQACGAPVIALAAGGALETVVDRLTGVHFASPTQNSLQDAVLDFENRETEFSPAACRDNALRFDRRVFQEQMAKFLSEVTGHRIGRAPAQPNPQFDTTASKAQCTIDGSTCDGETSHT